MSTKSQHHNYSYGNNHNFAIVGEITCYGLNGNAVIKEELLQAGVFIAGCRLANLDLDNTGGSLPDVDTLEGGLLAALHWLHCEPRDIMR